MRKLSILSAALLLAAALSCTREQDVNLSRTMTFKAVWADNPDTRTAIQSDGTSVWWSPNERIEIFGTDDSYGVFTSTNTAPEATATFEGTLEGGYGASSGTRYIGLYPYYEYSYYDNGKLHTRVQDVQQGKEGTFADGAFPAVSISDNNLLSFRHLCGGARFSVANEGIGSVTFEALGKEDLAGLVDITFNNDGTFVTEVSHDDSEHSEAVTVIAPEGGFIPGKYYFAALLPGTLSHGLKVTYSKLDGTFAEIELDKPITVNRARFGTIAGKDAGLTFHEYDITTPTAVDLGLSVKWASFNIGATKPQETGYYYAWGETFPKKAYNWGTYQWGEDEEHLTKYNLDASSGTVDNKLMLDPEDDVAHVRLGDKWRMPVQAEIEELLNTQYDDRYEWNLKTIDGVAGIEIVCLANGNSIFLPQTGLMYGSQRDREDCAILWSSSLVSIYPQYAFGLHIGISEYGTYATDNSSDRFDGLCVRPVYGDRPAIVPVESIVLQRSQLTLQPGVNYYMPARVLPENATDQLLAWRSSDESVVAIERDWFYAVAPGTATITVSTADGSRTATCQVTVKMPATTIATPDAVDLGLSVKWASFNIGATKPEESGNYYAWGEIEPKSEFNSDSYKWYDNDTDQYSKYCLDSAYGPVDNKYELDAEDDVAQVKLGGNWRIPTPAEMRELLDTRNNNGYRWQYKTINGFPGFEIVCLANNNSIFLPSSGYISGNMLSSTAQYWTSSLDSFSSREAQACGLYIYESGGPDAYISSFLDGLMRNFGSTVRPVFGQIETIPVNSVTLNRTRMDLSAGIKFSLNATIQPENATSKRLVWTSSDNSVATVDEGYVTCVAPGKTTITVSVVGENKSATCEVTVHDPSASFSTPTAVDLGLSVKWASFNVGASKPEQNGFFYAWGETEPKSQYDSYSYRWCDGSMDRLTKYNYDPFYGVVDYKSTLEDADDVAHVKLGGKWRMPTFEEIDELAKTKDNPGYRWTWKKFEDGCSGVEITCLANGNHIFLPASGYVDDYAFYGSDTQGVYWASSSFRDFSPGSGLSFSYEDMYESFFCYTDLMYRANGYSVRPVYGDPPAVIPVESISLNMNKAVVPTGAYIDLEASVLPENTTEITFWTSSDKSVATVDNGIVTGVAPGEATISIMTPNGKKKAFCQITVQDPATTFATPEAVDLGLSSKWATFNLGATAPEQPGNYYAWGEKNPESPYTFDYEWFTESSTGYGYTKYCFDPGIGLNGFTDGKTRLDPEDDIVRVKLGGKWRMPKFNDILELQQKCTWTWTELNGLNGFQVTGPSGKSIFLPATGILFGTHIDNYNEAGMIFSDQLSDDSSNLAKALNYSSEYIGSYCMYTDSQRLYGVSVRPVCD